MLYFIVNKRAKSGKGMKLWAQIRTVLKDKCAEYKAYNVQAEGASRRIASAISKNDDPDKRIIVVGGDGTVNEVINGITDWDRVKLGVIPCGSGNDFARGLGIKGSVEGLLERYMNSNVYLTVDVGCLSYGNVNRYFGISSGVGLDAIVCKKTNSSRLKKVLNKVGLGKLTYIILTVQTLFTMKTYDMQIRLADGTAKDYKQVIFLAGMNMVAEGGGVPMAPGASASDGRLSVCVAHEIPRWRAFLSLPFLVAAKHEGIKGYEVFDTEGVEIISKENVTLHGDGDVCGDVQRVKMTCVPDKLKVII